MRQFVIGMVVLSCLVALVGTGHGQDKGKVKKTVLAIIQAVSKEKVSFMLAKPKKDGKREFVVYFKKTKIEVRDEEGTKVLPAHFSKMLVADRPVALQIENGGDEKEPKKPLEPKRVVIYLKDEK